MLPAIAASTCAFWGSLAFSWIVAGTGWLFGFGLATAACFLAYFASLVAVFAFRSLCERRHAEPRKSPQKRSFLS
jgi:dipeptide/tripeptide permease